MIYAVPIMTQVSNKSNDLEFPLPTHQMNWLSVSLVSAKDGILADIKSEAATLTANKGFGIAPCPIMHIYAYLVTKKTILPTGKADRKCRAVLLGKPPL